MTMRRGLAVVLVAQCVLAILLVASDLEARLIPRLSPGPDVPDGPVSPGDQVRRYEPRETRPAYTDPSTLPDMELPTDLPERLEFTMQDAGEFGSVLLVHGAIEGGDADRFAAYLASLGDLTVPVALNSPGGIVDEALEIGRILRDRDAETAILSGMVCVLACPLHAGGRRRASRLPARSGRHAPALLRDSGLPSGLLGRGGHPARAGSGHGVPDRDGHRTQCHAAFPEHAARTRSMFLSRKSSWKVGWLRKLRISSGWGVARRNCQRRMRATGGTGKCRGRRKSWVMYPETRALCVKGDYGWRADRRDDGWHRGARG